MNKIKITIIKQDWEPGLYYTDPCGCLLSRAMTRMFGGQWSVAPGDVGPARIFLRGPSYDYDTDADVNGTRLEEVLADAHDNPDLLPLTIELTERT